MTCATTLYQAGQFDEQAIKHRTGQKSDTVGIYKRPSTDMEVAVSNCLQPPRPATTPSKPELVKHEPTATVSRPQSAPPQVLQTQSTCTTARPQSAPPTLTSNNMSQTLEISVPDCINKIVILKGGKKFTMEL